MKLFKVIYKAVKGLSIVGSPAIEEKFIKLSNLLDTDMISKFNSKIFCFSSVDKREIFTPLLIPDQMIKRFIPEVSPDVFLISFDAETIKQIVFDIINNKDFYFNLEHKGAKVDGVYLEQIFISNSDKGITPNDFDLPNGTAYAVLKVENDLIWNEILNGTFSGVSLEIDADLSDTGRIINMSQAVTTDENKIIMSEEENVLFCNVINRLNELKKCL